MAIRFFFKRRESLTAKSEVYKKSIRAYLESEGYFQTTDSFIEGSFEDMIFHNSRISPGKNFLIEAKAEILSFKSIKFAKELVKYFRSWQILDKDKRFKLIIFAQELKEPEKWENIFNEDNDKEEIKNWIKWYNKKREEKDYELLERDISEFANFLSDCEFNVATKIDLDNAVAQKEVTSAQSISRIAQSLKKIVDKRRFPNMERSTLLLNILPIEVPTYYFVANTTITTKQEIYDLFEGKLIPPFLYKYDKRLLTFVPFDANNPLNEIISDNIIQLPTTELLKEDTLLSSKLINIHLRRILWNRGLWRDDSFFYYPILDDSKIERSITGPKKRPKIVIRRYDHKEDTIYAKRGDVNFFFHHAIELRTPTYWEKPYLEIIPRRYYTHNGSTPIDGEIRAKIDAGFKHPDYDRGPNRISLMKFWRHSLFQSEYYEIEPEDWFNSFQFGDYITIDVNWSPKVIERSQTRLWDYEDLQ